MRRTGQQHPLLLLLLLSLKLSFVPDPQKQLTLELGYLGVAPLCQMKWSVDFHAATFLCLLKNFRAWPRQKSLKRWAVENVKCAYGWLNARHDEVGYYHC